LAEKDTRGPQRNRQDWKGRIGRDASRLARRRLEMLGTAVLDWIGGYRKGWECLGSNGLARRGYVWASVDRNGRIGWERLRRERHGLAA
jgi:hypothetical protein